MAKPRNEDLQMKIPALMHLSRLGYGYLTASQLRLRHRKSNFLPETLRAAIGRINGISPAPEVFDRLMSDLEISLEERDLGQCFYHILRDGWNGISLIDFVHPENNIFQSAAELSCGSGADSFRPDITLFVNGLPLAMIELKTQNRPRGLQAEYDRMLTRFRGKKGGRYLQCVQVWAFSDDQMSDPSCLLPSGGAFFAALMTDDFPVYPVREKYPGVFTRLLPRDPVEEKRILADNGISERPHNRTFQRNLSPQKMTHRMLTTLFDRRRFLFLLRYGIRYIRETDLAGQEVRIRRMLTTDQLFALGDLVRKAERGWKNWTVPSCGAAGEKAMNASMTALLRDLFPEARLFWVSDDEAALTQDREALESCGVVCAAPGEKMQSKVILFSATGDLPTFPGESEDTGTIREKGDHSETSPNTAKNFAVRSVFILPRLPLRYGEKPFLAAALRKADADAILITRGTSHMPESVLSSALPVHGEGALYYYAAVPDSL